MRRFARDRFEVFRQIENAAAGIAGEPAWPGAPSLAEVQQAVAALNAANMELRKAEQELRGKRFTADQARAKALELLRRIDHVTDALYGNDGTEKARFGLRPIDRVRNAPPPTPQVLKLSLRDGAKPGVLVADWKRIPQATYEVQWFADEELTSLLGAAVATRSVVELPPLPPGMQVWVRVRALRGRRYGEWSESATRIANV